MVMGLEDWENPYPTMVGEERLLQAVQAILGPQVSRLLVPPEAPEPAEGPANPFDESATIGVPVAAFPRWMLCPRCRALAALDSGLFQLKADLRRTDQTRLGNVNCTSAGAPPPVVPGRFLVACKYGHLDDFPWVYFVHGEVACKARLKLRELGVSGEAADIQVFCETCGKQRRMSEAFGQEGKNTLPGCSGRHPHLRTHDREPCAEQARAIPLGASTSSFSIVLSALAVPDAVDRLGQLVSEYWHILEKVTSQQNIELLRHIGPLGSFARYEDAHIWEKVAAEQRGSHGTGTTSPACLKVTA